MKNPHTYEEWLAVVPQYIRDEMLAIESGKILPSLTYDAVFKKIFDPDVHKERGTVSILGNYGRL